MIFPLKRRCCLLILLEQPGLDLAPPEAEREPDEDPEQDERPRDDENVEERDRLPGEHVLDVVDAAAADGRRLDLLGRQGEVDRGGASLGVRAAQALAEAGQLLPGRVEARLEDDAVLV